MRCSLPVSRNPICSSGPAANAGFPIIFCGTSPIPNSISAIRYGRTLPKPTWTRRWKTSGSVSGASEALPRARRRSMLRSRVITSVILATLVLALLLLVAGGWENARLAGVENPVAQAAWILVLCLGGAALIWATHIPSAIPVMLGGATVGWLLLALWLRFPAFGRPSPNGDHLHFQPLKLIVIGLILLAAFVAISWLHFYSPWRVVFCF